MPTSKPIVRRFDTGSDQEAIIPTGGGDFSPSGFIAPWNAAIVTRMYTKSDMMDSLGADNVHRDSKGGAQLYFRDYAVATEAAKTVGEGYLNQVWRFQTRVADVLNVADATKFQSPVLAMDVDVASLQSKKRAAYQQIALPAAVAAVAKGYGFDTPGFDLNELVDRNTVYNDAFFAKYIGNPDATPNDADHWLKSTTWQRRAELWAALGEPDPMKHITPHAERGRDSMRTKSDDLIACLEVVNRTWAKPIWARMVLVSDPHVDATYTDATGETKRRTLPVIWEMFFEKADAEKAAKASLTEDDAPIAVAKPSGGSESRDARSSTPRVPTAWVALGADDWMAALGDSIASGKSLPAMIKELDASKEDITAWRAHMGL